MADEIELKTVPADFRFPTTNQTRHCFTRYIEFHRCTAAKGEESKECERFAKYYRALCPGEWIEKWNEQREIWNFSRSSVITVSSFPLFFVSMEGSFSVLLS